MCLQHLNSLQGSLHLEQEASHHQGLSKVENEGKELPEDGARDQAHEAVGW